jgi:hypothetical protein
VHQRAQHEDTNSVILWVLKDVRSLMHFQARSSASSPWTWLSDPLQVVFDTIELLPVGVFKIVTEVSIPKHRPDSALTPRVGGPPFTVFLLQSNWNAAHINIAKLVVFTN